MSSLPHSLHEAQAWHFRAGPASLRVMTPDGRVSGAAGCAAEAAVVLDLAGDLLDALAATGLAPAADWHWAVQPGLPAGGARALWQGPGAQAVLTLPWALLRARRDAPVVPGLQWQPAPAECLLAQWRFTDEERAALEPGGALLLDAPCQRPRARSEPPQPADQPWQLVARWEAPVAVEALMGWGGELPPLPAACLLVETAWPDAVLARGRLMPWGSGQALHIEAC